MDNRNNIPPYGGGNMQGMPPQSGYSRPQQGMPANGMQRQGMPLQGMPPQGMPRQGVPRMSVAGGRPHIRRHGTPLKPIYIAVILFSLFGMIFIFAGMTIFITGFVTAGLAHKADKENWPTVTLMVVNVEKTGEGYRSRRVGKSTTHKRVVYITVTEEFELNGQSYRVTQKSTVDNVKYRLEGVDACHHYLGDTRQMRANPNRPTTLAPASEGGAAMGYVVAFIGFAMMVLGIIFLVIMIVILVKNKKGKTRAGNQAGLSPLLK